MAKANLSALCALLFCFTAHAQTVGVHIASVHQHGGMNNFNPGVYVRLQNGVTAGTYRNSVDRQSVYAGYTFETKGEFTAALTLGLVSGYRDSSLLVVPSLAYHHPIGSIRLGIVPKPKNGALHLMLEHHFK